MARCLDACEAEGTFAPVLERWRARLRVEPSARCPLPYEDRFDEAESLALRRHLIPTTRQDKWLALWRAPFLDFYASWTGVHVFRARFAPDGDGVRLASAWVNADPAERRPRESAREVALLRWLVRGQVLGQDVPFPFDPARSLEEALLEAFAVGGPAALGPDSPIWRAVPAADVRASGS